jgi:hypothetical protein
MHTYIRTATASSPFACHLAQQQQRAAGIGGLGGLVILWALDVQVYQRLLGAAGRVASALSAPNVLEE